MKKLRVIELFGGIGALTKALKELNIATEIVDYVEIDKYAVKSYNAINGTSFERQDIKEFNKVYKDIDLIMHGSPCQDFSIAGNEKGGDEGSGTRSSLMFETLRIVKSIKPKYVIWENVKNLLSKKHKHNFDRYLTEMENIGYKNYYQILNAKDFNIPQNRERIFTISIRKDIKKDFTFPEKEPLKNLLNDFLEKKVDESYYLSQKNYNYFIGANYIGTEKFNGNTRKNQFLRSLKTKKDNYIQTITTKPNDRPCGCFLKEILSDKLINEKLIKEFDIINHSYSNNRLKRLDTAIEKTNNISPTLTTRCDCLGVCIKGKKYIQDNKTKEILRIRKLTEKECWRLMGFSDNDFEKAKKECSKMQLYKQAGNSIVVNCLIAILKKLL